MSVVSFVLFRQGFSYGRLWVISKSWTNFQKMVEEIGFFIHLCLCVHRIVHVLNGILNEISTESWSVQPDQTEAPQLTYDTPEQTTQINCEGTYRKAVDGECVGTCGIGERNRTRISKYPEQCEPLIETNPCNLKPCKNEGMTKKPSIQSENRWKNTNHVVS